MQKIKLIEQPDGSFSPADPFPSDSVKIRGDIEPGYYLCYQPGDELPKDPE